MPMVEHLDATVLTDDEPRTPDARGGRVRVTMAGIHGHGPRCPHAAPGSHRKAPCLDVAAGTGPPPRSRKPPHSPKFPQPAVLVGVSRSSTP